MKIASAANSTARLITTSISKSRYRRTAMPIAIGINANDRVATICSTASQVGVVVPPHSELNDKIRMNE